jgi:hypothetical protein
LWLGGLFGLGLRGGLRGRLRFRRRLGLWRRFGLSLWRRFGLSLWRRFRLRRCFRLGLGLRFGFRFRLWSRFRCGCRLFGGSCLFLLLLLALQQLLFGRLFFGLGEKQGSLLFERLLGPRMELAVLGLKRQRAQWRRSHQQA